MLGDLTREDRMEWGAMDGTKALVLTLQNHHDRTVRDLINLQDGTMAEVGYFQGAVQVLELILSDLSECGVKIGPRYNVTEVV